jgi:hypothetical protein
VFTRGLNQHGDVVVSYKRTVMVYRRDAPQDKGLFPEASQSIEEQAGLG